MKLVNDKFNDLSTEGYANMAIFLIGAEMTARMGLRMSDGLDRIGAEGCFIQKQKHAFNEIRKNVSAILRNFDAAFNKKFEQIYDQRLASDMNACDILAFMANDMIRLLLVYYSRVDGESPEKRRSIRKAIMNFKPARELDLKSMLDFYGFDVD